MSKDTKKRHTNLTMIHLFESHLFNLSSVKQQRVVFLCLFDSSSCWSCWFFSISMMFHLGLVPLFILAWHLNSQLLAGLNLCNNYVSTVNPKLSYKSIEVIQGLLQRWTEHSTLIFENLKPVEISKNIFNII